MKTGKRVRFPLYSQEGEERSPTSVKRALDIVTTYYAKALPAVQSPWVFYTRKGDCYYNMENRRAYGFAAIWQRSMKKALAETDLEESFTEHDLRAKVGSDLATDQQATDLFSHSSSQITRKHYRLRGQSAVPAAGFFTKKDTD